MRPLSYPISLLIFAAFAETLCAAPPPHYFTTTAAGATPSLANPIALKQYLSGAALVYDLQGNLYSTGSTNQIWRLNADGTDTLIAGSTSGVPGKDNGVATAAVFTSINGAGFDAQQNLYIAELGTPNLSGVWNGSIYKVTPQGRISTVVPGIGATSLAVDAAGNMYSLVYGGNSVQAAFIQYSPTGTSRVINPAVCANIAGIVLDGGIAIVACFAQPLGLLQIDLQSGNISTLLPIPPLGGFAVGPDGFVYLSDGNSITKIKPGGNGSALPVAGTGQATSTGDGGLETQATFGSGEIAVNPVNGDIALFDTVSYTIRVISAATGKIQTVAGSPHSSGDNGPAVLALFQLGTGLASDPSGDVYFWDTVGVSIRKIAPSGIVTKVAGTGTPGYSGDGGKAVLAAVSPAGNLAADTKGNLYFVNAASAVSFSSTLGLDTQAVTIRKIDVNGLISTILGGGAAPLADGASASSVSLTVGSRSAILTTDSVGNLYLAYTAADKTGARILKIDTSEIIRVIAGGGPLNRDPDGTPATAIILSNIVGLAVDNAGVVYFGDGNYGFVRTIDSQGLLGTYAGNGNNSFNGSAIQAGPALSTQIGTPQQFTFDSSGNLIFYAATTSAGPQIVLVDRSGNLTPIAGAQPPLGTYSSVSAGDGGDAAQASFASIAGLTVDPSGSIYVADAPGELSVASASSYIRKLAPYNPSNPPPFLSAGGVIGAGGSVPAVVAVSPNGDATIYGANFPAAHTLAPSDLVNGQVPTKLTGVCASFGGVPAAMLGVYPTQINVQVPTLPPGPVTVQVTLNCGTSSAVASNFAGVVNQTASPEFFAFLDDPAGNNPIAALNAVTGVLIGAPGLLAGATFGPAKAGDIVEAYGTGWGITNPPFGVGVIPGAAGSLAAPYTLTLVGTAVPPSNILYAGVAPCCAGLYQVNFTMPAGIPSGNQPLVITVSGVPSPPHAFITVQ
jgi:uncharacterized protein (TIGR03437 family)